MTTNTITLVGNTTRDPELRYTPSGKAVALFSIAVDRRYQQDDQWVENTSFFDVVVWSDLGQNAAASIHKGDRVLVTGRMEQRNWTDDAGHKHTKLELIATDVGASLRWTRVIIPKAAVTSGCDDVAEEPEFANH